MDPAVFTAAELVAATDGVWWRERRPVGALGVYTDSREDGAQRIFVALAGERFDAHDFLDAARRNGAAAWLVGADRVDRIPADPPLPVLVVPDTLRAYQQIARHHRERFPALRLAAVTGSVGKTSVKEMLRAIFTAEAGEAAVLHTVGNTNNQIGVPRNLLRLTAAHRYAVIEMGTNHHGEIAPLSRTAQPTAALVNSIAPCHLEFLGDLDGVAREKGHIFSALPPGAAAVLPAACPGRAALLEAAAILTVGCFGAAGSGAEVEAEYLAGTLNGSRIALRFRAGGERLELDWGLTGAHQAMNAAAAATLAWRFGIAPTVIARGLAQCELPGMRMRISRHRDVTWVNDAYNANPESMAALIRHLETIDFPAGLVLVLGDMLELGTAEAALHREVLALAAARLPAARLVTVGPRFGACGGAAAEAFADAPAAHDRVAELTMAGGVTVVLKGSRGMALELTMPEEARHA